MRKVIMAIGVLCAAVVLFSCGTVPASEEIQSNLTDAAVEESGSGEAQEETVTDKEGQEAVAEDEKEEADRKAKEEADRKAKAEAIRAANEEAMQKAQAARDNAIEKGAEDSAGEELGKVDALYAAAKQKAETGEDMKNAFMQITDLYNALAEYSMAVEIKQQVDSEGYEQYDKADYAKGSAALDELKLLLEDDNATASEVMEKAHIAYISYNRVLITAFKSIAQGERKAAFIAKKNADSVYANVSRKEDYNAAVKEFRAGDASYAMQNPNAAAEHYTAAKNAFEALYSDIGDKMAEAEAAIREAQAASVGSEEYARKADNDSPLKGDNIEGIEEHDAVLLEEIEYDDPEETIEVIPESIDDMDETDIRGDGDDTGEADGGGDTDDEESDENDEGEGAESESGGDTKEGIEGEDTKTDGGDGDTSEITGESEKIGEEYTEADDE